MRESRGTPDTSKIGEACFVVDGVLAGIARPRLEDSDDDLQRLVKAGFAGLVSLTESPLDPEKVRRAGLEYLHLPIRDFHAPSISDVSRFVEFVRRVVAERNGPVAVHCGSGLGRTGTMLACYLVSEGKSPEEALAYVRKLRPGSVETDSQEAAIRAWGEEVKRKRM